MQTRQLIVNADDFGISPGVNRGIITAHEHGIVTSASLMTRWPAAVEAAEYARGHLRFGVGLHVDLGEWICRDGEWQPLYQVIAEKDAGSVKTEILRQLDNFRRLLGRDPDHLDSHQHAHREEPARSILLELASKLNVPLRHFSSQIRYCGAFYGQTEEGATCPELVDVENITRIIQGLQEGATELCCHPAAAADLSTMYLHERLIELQTLCDPRLPSILADAGVTLCSFSGEPHHGLHEWHG